MRRANHHNQYSLKCASVIRTVFLCWCIFYISTQVHADSASNLIPKLEQHNNFESLFQYAIPRQECGIESSDRKSKSASNQHDNVKGQMSLKLTPREKSQCLISVEKARKLWDKNKLIFVDVRSSANYEVAHIPKSINIQSHLIKTKPFLKDQYTVIVSKGHTLQESLLTCASLRKQGFNNVAALRGGLYTWSQSAPIVGAIKSAKLDQLLPSEFFEAHKERRWFVINTLINSQDVTGLFPGKEIIHYKGNIKEFESTYRKQTSQRSRQKPTFLIVGGEDRHFPELISAINKKQHEGIYYLSSSINSYRAYLVNQQKMLAKLAKGPKRVVRCGG